MNMHLIPGCSGRTTRATPSPCNSPGKTTSVRSISILTPIARDGQRLGAVRGYQYFKALLPERPGGRPGTAGSSSTTRIVALLLLRPGDRPRNGGLLLPRGLLRSRATPASNTVKMVPTPSSLETEIFAAAL